MRVCVVSKLGIRARERFKVLPFTDDLSKVKESMGSGPAPSDAEAAKDAADILGGLKVTLLQDWTKEAAKRVFILCDVPYIGKEFLDPSWDTQQIGSPRGLALDNLMKELCSKEIAVHVVKISNNCNKMIEIMKASHEKLEVTDMMGSIPSEAVGGQTGSATEAKDGAAEQESSSILELFRTAAISSLTDQVRNRRASNGGNGVLGDKVNGEQGQAQGGKVQKVEKVDSSDLKCNGPPPSEKLEKRRKELHDAAAPKESLQHQLCISKTTLLEDTASVSQSLFGNFLPRTEGPKLVLLRANSVIEAYSLNNGEMTLVTTYRATGFKISKIIKVRKPVPCLASSSYSDGHKDMIVAQILPLKFVTLEIDEEINEFRIVCIHNLSNDVRLQESGRLNSAR